MQLHKRAFLAVLAIASGVQVSPVQAAVIGGTQGVITEYSVFPDLNGGDVIFMSDGAVGTCYGFWLRPTDAGFKLAYSTLMTAYATKLPLRIWVHDNSSWSGSGSNYCRVYRLNPV
jgi:hypothetical protein